MAHAQPALPRFDLDAKRIAGTSLVIALHAGVLMMLMTPVQRESRAVVEEEQFSWIVPDVIPIPPPPPPPPPIQRQLRQETPVPQVPVQETVVEPVDQTFNPIDVIAEPVVVDTTATSFETGPVTQPFAQLATTVAPAPTYPSQALRRQLQGTVTLRIHVDASGVPIEVLVENSSGHAILDQAALKVVKSRWRFVPATQNGVAIEAWALVPVEFVLQ